MGHLSVTAIDLLVGVVILVSAGFAAFRGLIHETFAIIEWVVAAILALRLTPVFQPLLRDVISPAWLAWIVAFLGVFLLALIPFSIVSHRLSQAVKKSEIGPIDRAFGFFFGIGRGLVIVGLAYIAFSALVPARSFPESLTKARLYPLIRDTGAVLRSLGPARLEERDVQTAAQNPVSQAPSAKTYGAKDRSALDRLFETSAGGGNSSR